MEIKKLVRTVVGLLAVFTLLLSASPAMADLCYLCGSGSSNGCNQCRARGGKDTSEARKICRKLGCKITGTSSCSSAANVKVCKAERPGTVAPASTPQQTQAYFTL